jgi:hypothetical protein
MKGRIRWVVRLARDRSVSRREGEDLEHGSAGTSDWSWVGKQEIGSAGVDGERGGAE